MADDTRVINGDPPVAALHSGFVDRKELTTVAFARTRMLMVITDARQPTIRSCSPTRPSWIWRGSPADEVLGRNCRFLQGAYNVALRKPMPVGRNYSCEARNKRTLRRVARSAC